MEIEVEVEVEEVEVVVVVVVIGPVGVVNRVLGSQVDWLGVESFAKRRIPVLVSFHVAATVQQITDKDKSAVTL